MLFLQLKDKEYLTIGDDIVIQVFTNSTIRVSVQAPRELAVLRGEVLERQGGQRPACLSNLPPRKKPRYRSAAAFLWNEGRERAVGTLEKLAAQLEEGGAAEEARLLREQLRQLVPSPWEEELSAKVISSGSQPAEI